MRAAKEAAEQSLAAAQQLSQQQAERIVALEAEVAQLQQRVAELQSSLDARRDVFVGCGVVVVKVSCG